MSLDEFRDLCIEAGFLNDTREIDLCVHEALMNHKQEMAGKKHLELSYVEFLEALCRVFNHITVLLEEEKSEDPHANLRTKIVKNIQRLIEICPQAIREPFVQPTQEDYFKMMYRPKNKNS